MKKLSKRIIDIAISLPAIVLLSPVLVVIVVAIRLTSKGPAIFRQEITGKTKVIIAQHTYGYPCDMDAIMEIAQQKNITVIEDCCLALGSKYKGKMVGKGYITNSTRSWFGIISCKNSVR